MKITIRKAKLSDVPAIDRLGNGLVDYHVKIYTKDDAYYNKRNKKADSNWRKWVRKNIKSKNGLVLIAYHKEKPVGYCLSFIKNNIPLFKINKYGYVSDLYVEKSCRGKGIGKKLLNESKKFFKNKKIRYMELVTNHNNYKSIKFYQKYGFKEYSKTMRIRI
jgi:ribosomal protein S18 acetylase RimI-like enzyme